MDIPGILDFLKVLAANNNREWFQEHKAEYLSVQADFEELLAGVIARLSPWDEVWRTSFRVTARIASTGMSVFLPTSLLIRPTSEGISMQGERNPITVVIIFIWNRATVCWPEEAGACLPICCGRCVSRCATALMSIVPLWKIRLSRSISRW